MLDYNRFSPLVNPKIAGDNTKEADQLQTTANSFANNQVSSTTRESAAQDNDYEYCPNCSRKFFAGRLQLHLKSCKEGKPLKPVKAMPLQTKSSISNDMPLNINKQTDKFENDLSVRMTSQENEGFEPYFGNQNLRSSNEKVSSLSVSKTSQRKADIDKSLNHFEAKENNQKSYPAYEDRQEGEGRDNNNNEEYQNMLENNDGEAGENERVKCSICGRSFHSDRIEKHEKACAKSNKKRPVFDTTKQRVKYVKTSH